MERDARRQRAEALDRWWDDLLLDATVERPSDVDEVYAATMRRVAALGDAPGRDEARARIWQHLVTVARERQQAAPRPAPTAPLTIDRPSFDPNGRADSAPIPLPAARRWPERSRWAVAQLATAALILLALLAGLLAIGPGRQELLERVPFIVIDEEATPFPGVTSASDVPMFRGDPGRSGVLPGPAIAGTPTQRWRFQAEGAVLSAPAVVDGVVYAGCDCDLFYALDAATGEERWRFQGGGGFVTSPAVVDGVVYAGNTDGNLYALDARDGSELWRALASRDSVGPAVADGVVYSVGADSALHALDAETGAALWRAELGAAASRLPGVAAEAVFAGDEAGVVHAFARADGRELWRFQTEGGGQLGSTAVVDGVVYQGTQLGTRSFLYALDAATGAERWRFETSSGNAARVPAVGDGVVYTASDTYVLALDAATGEERWRFDTGGFDIRTAPVLVDGVLYVPSYARQLHALDAATGAELWRFPIDGTTDYGPTVAGGVAYIGTVYGGLYAIGGTDADVVGDGAGTPAASVGPPRATIAAPAATSEHAAFLWTIGGPEPTTLAFSPQIAVDPEGNLWVVDGARGRFQIFAPDGTPLATWGELGSGEGQFNFQRDNANALGSIAFAPDGGFYVADSQNARIQQFDAARNFVRAWGTRGDGDGQFLEPVDVDLDAAGNVYVIDGKHDDVQKFTADGRFLLRFAGQGGADGELRATGWGALDAAGNLWVADTGNARLQQFSPDGRGLRTIERWGLEPNQRNNPQAIGIDAAGRLFVTDANHGRVSVFDAAGGYLFSLNGADAGGTQFIFPVGIAIDPAGNLYVHDYDVKAETVQKFRLVPDTS